LAAFAIKPRAIGADYAAAHAARVDPKDDAPRADADVPTPSSVDNGKAELPPAEIAEMRVGEAAGSHAVQGICGSGVQHEGPQKSSNPKSSYPYGFNDAPPMPTPTDNRTAHRGRDISEKVINNSKNDIDDLALLD
jgi:hypothetical protein